MESQKQQKNNTQNLTNKNKATNTIIFDKTHFKSNHYILLENRSATMCHINAAVNILLQSPNIYQMIYACKIPRINDKSKAAMNLRGIIHSQNKHQIYSLKRFCGFMGIKLDQQDDANQSFLECLRLMSFLKTQQKHTQLLDYEFQVQTQSTRKNSHPFKEIYNSLNLTLDSKKSTLKDSITHYFSGTHYASASKLAEACHYNYTLISFPKIFFITVNWRLTIHFPKAVEKGLHKFQAKINKTKSKKTRQTNGTFLQELRNCANPRFTKIKDTLKFSQKMTLTINSNQQTYHLMGVVSHKGNINDSSNVSGHYVTYLKSQNNDNYYLIDDSQITKTDIKFKDLHDTLKGKPQSNETGYIFVYSSYNT